MESCKTKKNRSKINKKKIFESFSDDMKNSSNMECIYKNIESSICDICNNIIAQTEEGYYACTNNKCAILYNDVFDNVPEWKQSSIENGGTDNSRCGMPINPYLQESSFGCKINCNNNCSYEMRKIKRYTEWQSMPYKEKSQYDEFQRIINMGQNSGISKMICDDAIRYHKIISEYKTFRGLNRDGIIAASIYISSRINKTPRSAKEIATIFHLDNGSATKGCKNAITIINSIEENLSNEDKTDLGTTNAECFIERYCSKIVIPQELIKLALFVSKIINRDNLIPENTPPAIAAGIIYFIINEFNLDVSKKSINQISEISEVTINKCYKKMLSFKEKLIPIALLKKYNKI